MGLSVKRGPDGLTDQQREFVKSYARTGNATQSALAAGYGSQGGGEPAAASRGSALLRKDKIRQAICDELEDVVREHGPRMLTILADLAINAQSESVRLSAITDLLDRSGVRVKQVVEIPDIPEADRKARIIELLAELGVSAPREAVN